MKQNLLCPKCGRASESLYLNLCEQCYTGNLMLLQHPDVVSIHVCPACNAYRRKGKWKPVRDPEHTYEDTVLVAAMDSIQLHSEAIDQSIELAVQQVGNTTYKVHVDAEAIVLGCHVNYNGSIEVRLQLETCDICSRISGGYYEAIIQLRGTNRAPTREEIEQYTRIIEQQIEHSHERGDRFSFITKIEHLKEGEDFYLGSKKTGKSISQKIVVEYGATLTESAKLVGRKDGIDVYRMTYALRLSPFNVGDILDYDNKFLQVLKIGSYIASVDLVTGNTVKIDKKRMINAKKIADVRDAKVAIVVSSDDTTVQILDPDTYKTVTLKKPAFMPVENELQIVKTDNEILIIR